MSARDGRNLNMCSEVELYCLMSGKVTSESILNQLLAVV